MFGSSSFGSAMFASRELPVPSVIIRAVVATIESIDNFSANVVVKLSVLISVIEQLESAAVFSGLRVESFMIATESPETISASTSLAINALIATIESPELLAAFANAIIKIYVSPERIGDILRNRNDDHVNAKLRTLLIQPRNTVRG